MDLRNKKIILIGGAGLIGSYTVEKLLNKSVKEIIIYDNFTTDYTPVSKDNYDICNEVVYESNDRYDPYQDNLFTPPSSSAEVNTPPPSDTSSNSIILEIYS